ncbi:hypothetical protein [Streptomyces niveus]|uniref:RCC1 domain-containing protein n=1 Tax=Streptomyces niveus TaxID=193462 RepID=UPI00214FA0BA|nr:hypothetical protein [Streptomyces niveus]
MTVVDNARVVEKFTRDKQVTTTAATNPPRRPDVAFKAMSEVTFLRHALTVRVCRFSRGLTPTRTGDSQRARHLSLSCVTRPGCAITSGEAPGIWASEDPPRPDTQSDQIFTMCDGAGRLIRLSPHRPIGKDRHERNFPQPEPQLHRSPGAADAAGDAHGVGSAPATAQEGRLKGWGANDNYQLGGVVTSAKYQPVTVPGLTGGNITSLAAGYYHSLALLSNGTVESWGRNIEGQLGIGSVTNQDQASTVTGLRGVVAVAAGNTHSLALLADGTVKAWGSNGSGQLGDNTVATRTTPVTVSGLTNVEAIAAGSAHSLAVLADGTVKAWGTNGNGQLGDNSLTQRNTPVTVTGLANVRSVAAGNAHSLARLADGTVWAWGYNAQGQLGDNSLTQRLTPVKVDSITTAREISAGIHHSVARLADGTVKTWGYNAQGQQGDGTLTNRPAPITLDGATNIRAISAGHYHTLVLDRDGKVSAVGYNNNGQIGDGTTANRTALTTPVNSLSSISLIAAGGEFSLAG